MTAVTMRESFIGTLARARNSLGLSRSAVGKRIGTTAPHIRALESEPEKATLTPDQLAAWAAAVGCTVKVTRNDVECGA